MEDSELTIKEGYKQTDVGILPEDWKVSTVGREFEIKLGRDQRKNSFIAEIQRRHTAAVENFGNGNGRFDPFRNYTKFLTASRQAELRRSSYSRHNSLAAPYLIFQLQLFLKLQRASVI